MHKILVEIKHILEHRFEHTDICFEYMKRNNMLLHVENFEDEDIKRLLQCLTYLKSNMNFDYVYFPLMKQIFIKVGYDTVQD